MEDKILKQEVDIIISIQAQKVLESSKYTFDDFKNWIDENKQLFSFGGSQATKFLEDMYNKENI